MKKCLLLLLAMTGGIMKLVASHSIVIDDQRCLCSIDGKEYPAIGFGTYPLQGNVCRDALEMAAKIGYRIIDTATYYRNFDGIANALKGQERSRFYLISKVWHNQQSTNDLRIDLERTLRQLDTDYIDAYLLHWPNSEIPIEETLTAMQELRQEKKIRHIGFSNVNANHLKRALELGIPIAWVQVEMNPYFYDADLLKFCKEHSIAVQAWGPLGRGRISADDLLKNIGKKYGKTSSQVAIRWIIQHGCLPLPGSKNEMHIQENWGAMDFMLSADEMEEIDKRARVGERERYSKAAIGFNDELDFTYEECWPKRIEAKMGNNFSDR